MQKKYEIPGLEWINARAIRHRRMDKTGSYQLRQPCSEKNPSIGNNE